MRAGGRPSLTAGSVLHRTRLPLTVWFWASYLVTNSGRSAWFLGALVVMVYLIFAMTLYLLPPRVQ